LTKKNNPYLETGTGLYEFPHTPWPDGDISKAFDANGYILDGFRTSTPIGKLPYMEITAGFENIFKFIRIDYVRRLTYNDYELPFQVPDGNGNMIQARRRIPAWGRNGVKITVRFAL